MDNRRRRADRTAEGWSGTPPSRRLSVLLLLTLLVCSAPPAPLRAQAARRAPGVSPALQPLARALNEGRYDEAEQLADKLDARDPAVATLKARATIARGRYAQAELALAAVATRAASSEAALELGLLQQKLGRPDATTTLGRVAALADQSNDAAELARAGRALRALGRFQEANAAYRDAARAAPSDPVINTGWGELFLETYNRAEAVRSFQAALQVDSRYVPALLGLAEAVSDDNPPQAVAMVGHALEVNPSSVDARVFLASEAIDEGRRDDARHQLQQALTVNPSSPEIHSWLAAIAYVEDKTPEFDAEVAKVLAVTPGDGTVYRIAGEVAARSYRFDEAVALTRRALALRPGDPRALADAGTHLLRTGDEPAARAALEASFKIDPYNVVTFNLLGLMDTLDTFTTVRDGDLVVRMHKDEAPVLQDYAVSLAQQALSTFSARYDFTPQGPILIEIFPRHDDFAVRNVGLPGMIGALGACFGRVVTLDSPRARPPGSFQWEAALWHELAHVVTLQMSNQRVPRWLTEGISEYEEKRARADWARQMDVEFAMRLERNQTMPLRELNAGFTDPHKISLAYYEASLLVEHIVTAYGDAGMRRLLRAFGAGQDTDAALKSALNTDFDRLQAGFDQMLDRMFGNMRRVLAGPDEKTLAGMSVPQLRAAANDQPRAYRLQMALGRALLKAGQADEAMQAFERAAPLLPSAAGQDSPHAYMAELALGKKDRARATLELQALVAVDFDNVEAARKLAAQFRDAGVDDPAKLRPVYQRIAAVDPFDAEAHRMLGRLALQRGEPTAAIREFRALVALSPVDAAPALTDLAESYMKAGRTPEAKKHVLAALEIAPTYERAQTLLLALAGDRR